MGIRRQLMIEVSKKYALDIRSPAPITSERQHEKYLLVLDKLASKESPTAEEEKYAQVLMTLIEAYEDEHDSVPDASPVEVLPRVDGCEYSSPERLSPNLWIGKHRIGSAA
jgi:hypothetical protein